MRRYIEQEFQPKCTFLKRDRDGVGLDLGYPGSERMAAVAGALAARPLDYSRLPLGFSPQPGITSSVRRSVNAFYAGHFNVGVADGPEQSVMGSVGLSNARIPSATVSTIWLASTMQR